MKTFILLFSLTSLFSGITFAQVSGQYSFDDPIEKDVSYYISLYKNGTFEFTINESLTNDMGLVILLSYGNYMLKNGNIELQDKYNGFNMQFEYHQYFLIAKKSYNGFVGNKFIKIRSSQEMGNSLSKEIKTIKQIISTLNASNLKENVINSGIYEGEYEKFNLNLSVEYTYVFKYHSFVISKGNWSRKKNELVLFDSILNHHFYLFIGKNGLYNLFIPGFHPIGSLLKKV
jgi:hypothetical protein